MQCIGAYNKSSVGVELSANFYEHQITPNVFTSRSRKKFSNTKKKHVLSYIIFVSLKADTSACEWLEAMF